MSAAAKKRAERAQIVRFHFEDSDEVAGSRRIAAAMARAGQPASRDAVRSIMRENGWVGQRPRKRPPVTTVPAEDADQLTDKLQRDFTAEAPGLKLVGDITYVPTWAGMAFTAFVMLLPRSDDHRAQERGNTASSSSSQGCRSQPWPATQSRSK